MKNIGKFFLFWLLLTAAPVFVSADVSGRQEPDYATDYFMIVESPDGGINMYPQADWESPPLNNELIPNGTALRIMGEITDEDKRVWGDIHYHGMNGYVPLDDCAPATEQEAIDSELYIAGDDHRNYEADYDITVSEEDEAAALRRGPGEKYDRVSGSEDIPSGIVLHMTQDVEMKDGTHWGMTDFDGLEGWVNLDGLKNWRETRGDESPADSSDDIVEAIPPKDPDAPASGTDDRPETGENSPETNREYKAPEETGNRNNPEQKTESAPKDASAKPTAAAAPTPKSTAALTPAPKSAAALTPAPKSAAAPTPTPKRAADISRSAPGTSDAPSSSAENTADISPSAPGPSAAPSPSAENAADMSPSAPGLSAIPSPSAEPTAAISPSAENAATVSPSAPGPSAALTPDPEPTAASTSAPASTVVPASSAGAASASGRKEENDPETSASEKEEENTPETSVSEKEEGNPEMPASGREELSPGPADMADDQEASSQEVKTAASPLKNPFVWIGGLSILAVMIVLIHHLKAMAKDK